MTAGKLDEVSAKPVASNPLRPLAANDPIFAADDVSASHRGEFSQRKRQGEAASRLGSKTLDCSLRSRFVTVGVHQCLSKSDIGPYSPRLSVELQPLKNGRIQLLRLITQLIGEASTDLWKEGAQVHQVAHRTTGRDEREGVPAV